MNATRDHRINGVILTMHISEFREHVEWLEEMAPSDACTRDWRAELDRVDPPTREEDVSAQS